MSVRTGACKGERSAEAECRVGTGPATVFVTMARYFAPDFFRVAEPLASLLSIQSGSRGQVLRQFRAYVAEHSTVDAKDPRKVTPAAPLHALLGLSLIHI